MTDSRRSADRSADRPHHRHRTLRNVVLVLLTLNAFALGLVLATADPGRAWTRLFPSLDLTNIAKKIGADADSVVGDSTANEPPIPTKPADDPRFAFLLLGYGGGDHPGAYLTDSIMVVIVDPTRKTLTLLSLPRDSWVPLLFDGKTPVYNKLNTAYAFARDQNLFPNRLDRYKGEQGAGTFAMDTVSRLLGIPISHYLALDFAGFQQMIDAVGGIDIDVPEAFAAKYPANDNPAIDPSWTIVRFEKGRQHMNGARAIQYARAREVIDNPHEAGDFARARRQRLIIEAFKARLFEPGGLVHLPELLAIASKHVDTNEAIPSIPQLAQLAMAWHDVQFYQTALTNENYLDEGTGPGDAYVLVPSTPDRSWSQIRAFTRRLWADPATGVAMANTRVIVQNDAGVAGVAGRLTTTLRQLGYRVGPPTTGSVRQTSRLVDRTGGEANLVAEQLRRDLGVDLPTIAEPSDEPADLVLELGVHDARLADITVQPDARAPVSFLGVQVADNATSSRPTPPATTTAAMLSRRATSPPSTVPTSTIAARSPSIAGTSPPTVPAPPSRLTNPSPTSTRTSPMTIVGTPSPTSGEATPQATDITPSTLATTTTATVPLRSATARPASTSSP